MRTRYRLYRLTGYSVPRAFWHALNGGPHED
jgi:hypothetical protein